jgi:hypothetical protein
MGVLELKLIARPQMIEPGGFETLRGRDDLPTEDSSGWIPGSRVGVVISECAASR